LFTYSKCPVGFDGRLEDFNDPGPDLCVDLSVCFAFCSLSVKSKFFCQRLTSNRVDNCGQVFGTQKLYWVLPMYTQEDQKKMTVLHGLDYPLRPDLES